MEKNLIEMQLPIEGVAYAFCKYHFSYEELSSVLSQHTEITNRIVNRPKPETIQSSEENKMYQQMFESAQIQSEQKSKFIEALKNEIPEERYLELKKQVFESDDFKAITKHT